MKLMIDVRPDALDKLREMAWAEHRTTRNQLEYIVHQRLDDAVSEEVVTEDQEPVAASASGK